MAKRGKPRGREAQLAFEAISIEGGLLSPEWLSKIAQLAADRQSESDYRVPKGLNLRDEIGRYWRIAQAHWSEFSVGLKASADRQALAGRFITSLLPDCFGFSSLAAVAPVTLEGRNFPLGYAALSGRVPVVVAPAASGIDTLAYEFGDENRRRSAFGLAQEYLNAAQDAVWGIATDGSSLRIVRDNASLTRPAWIEVDLGRIFAEERYADFAALWLLAHETRFGAENQPSTECALEAWRSAGREEGTRAREHLRRGVEEALAALGQGFLSHRENQSLRAALADGSLTTRDYFGQLLRLVYRLIFLLTVEERNLLHPEGASESVRSLYRRGYSLRRLCDRSVKRSAHDRFGDLWESVKIVLRGLSDGEPRLGLPALAGIFDSKHCPALDAAHLENRFLLLALYKLAWLRDEGALARVNWRDMGSEELGSVYESLLELIPQITEQGRKFGFVTAAGNERKTSGSYYTPSSLVECLLDSALDPVIDQRLAGKFGADAEKAILSLRVCDPACGSGHFLVAAAHRLARRLAAIRANTEQPTLQQLRHALREVISRCLYGVDLNPMAVELCKVTLWLEATEPGKPLGFLEHHVQCGNSLFGTTPKALNEGIPDDAFKPLTGDDPDVCRAAKKLNKEERSQLQLFHGSEAQPWEHLGSLPAAMLEVETMSDDTADALHRKEQSYAELVHGVSYENARFLADAWCAAFVWKKSKPADGGFDYAITNDVLRKIERNPHDCAPWMRAEIERLRDRYQFFHWHLAFPEVFPLPGKGQRAVNEHAGWNGGFDVMLGNPPWEKLQSEELQFFSARRPDIVALVGAERKTAIDDLARSDPTLAKEWDEHRRFDAGTIAFIRGSNVFPLTAVGKFNTFALFAELGFRAIGSHGRLGCIVPSGIATDDTTKDFFGALVDSRALVRLLDFENRNGLFPGVHRSFKFCLLTVAGRNSGSGEPAEFAFYALNVRDVTDPERRFVLSSEDIERLNPNTKNCPTFRTRRDAEITKAVYSRIPVFLNQMMPHLNAHKPSVWRLLNTTDDSAEFVSGTNSLEPVVPVVEAKCLHQFDHRYATFTDSGAGGEYQELSDLERKNPSFSTRARHYIRESLLRERLPVALRGKSWFMTARNIARATDERTFIASVFPRGASCELTPYIEIDGSPKEAAVLLAAFNSFAFDFIARQKVGGTHISYFIIYQLPVLPPAAYDELCAWGNGAGETVREWLLPRVLELTCTAWDLNHFAYDCGWFGPPFEWDESRRFQIRCELDAAFFHLYGLNRDDTAYILDTFPIVRRKDEEKWGEYRTKRIVLEIYDALRDAAQTGNEYLTALNPIPASFRCMHAPRLPDDKRVALDSAPKFLLSFVSAFLRQTGKEATFDLLDSVFHMLRHRSRYADEFSSAIGSKAKQWAETFDEQLPNKEFVPFLKRLEADGWIAVSRTTGHLRMTEKFPAVTFDPWRNFDVSAALRVIAHKPEVAKFVLADASASLASREFASQKVG